MVERGRLATSCPENGERVDVLHDRGAVVEHILTGRLSGPQTYRQDHDEWVLLLSGWALLEIDEPGGTTTSHTLSAGDWIVLPARSVHRLVRADAGTRWLAVHDRVGGAA